MAGEITIGNTTLDRPAGYVHNPIKLETYNYSLRGKLITNRTVTAEDQPVSRYHFEIPGINNSEMFDIKGEAVKIGDLDYIDYFKIREILSGDGSTKIFYTQRRMSGDTPVPEVILDDESLIETVNELTNPDPGNVYIKADVSGIETYSFFGGTGYAALEVLTVVQTGASGGTFRINTVNDNGVILNITRLTRGMNYNITNNLATTVNTGSGTGATISVLTIYHVARFIFGDTPSGIKNKIEIKYEPKYYVHIFDYSHVYMIGNVANTLLICEESK